MNISRESGTRVAAIGVFIQGRDMGSVVQEMQQRVDEERQAARRATSSPGAASSRTSSARWRGCSVIVPISVLLIFVLLFNAFGSVQERGADSAERAVRAGRRHPGAARSPGST